MSTRILKFELQITVMQEVMMPEDAKILSIQVQDDKVQMWAQCIIGDYQVPHPIYCFGTGQEISVDLSLYHLETVQKGSDVWHFYELG